MKVRVELRSAEAFKCMTAVKDMRYYDQRIILSVEHQEVYATDGFGVVISPAIIEVTQDVSEPQRELPSSMILKLSNVKVPKGAERVIIMIDDWFNDGASYPVVTSRAEPIGFATVANGDNAPNVRNVVPKEHHYLPAAPPKTFNPAFAMNVLKNSWSLSKGNYASLPIKIGSQVAYQWCLENEGEFVLMGLRGEADDDRVFWQLVNERNGGKR